jgi:hypothetical protein
VATAVAAAARALPALPHTQHCRERVSALSEKTESFAVRHFLQNARCVRAVPRSPGVHLAARRKAAYSKNLAEEGGDENDEEAPTASGQAGMASHRVIAS